MSNNNDPEEKHRDASKVMKKSNIRKYDRTQKEKKRWIKDVSIH